MRTVYIAGPMRGYPYYNFPAFDEAAERFRAHDWRVISPAELDREHGFHEYMSAFPPNFLRDAMKRDMAAICECDAIALLDGYEASEGAAVELALAQFLDLRILDAQTMEEMAWSQH